MNNHEGLLRKYFVQTKAQPSLVSAEEVRSLLSQAEEVHSVKVKRPGARGVLITFALGVAVTATFLLLPGSDRSSTNPSPLSGRNIASAVNGTDMNPANGSGNRRKEAEIQTTDKKESIADNSAIAPHTANSNVLSAVQRSEKKMAMDVSNSSSPILAGIEIPSFTAADLAQIVQKREGREGELQSNGIGNFPLPEQQTLGYKIAHANLVPLPEVPMTPGKISIRPLTGLNTPYYDDYNPMVTADGRTLYFISNREHGFGGHDFWVARKKNREDIHFSEPQNLGSGINTSRDEGGASISADGQTMYFTGCHRPDGLGECDIYEARLEEEGWVEVRNLQEVNSRDWEAQPTISADGRTLYFVSNRPGVLGNHNDADIYVSHKLADGMWSKPANLGNPINTKKREDSPFIAPGGDALYFSSAGHKGVGGLDFYVSHKGTNGEWMAPENLGTAFNTPNDERFITLPAAEDVIYYASSDGKGGLDLFMAQREASSSSIVLNGAIIQQESGAGLSAELLFVDGITGEVLAGTKTNDETGEYSLVIGESSREHLIYVFGINNSLGEFRAKITLPSTNSYREYRCDLMLSNAHGTADIGGEWKPELAVTPGIAPGIFAVTAPQEEWGELTILDAWGHQLIQKFIKSEGAEKIDLSTAPEGLYLVRLGKNMAVVPIDRPRPTEKN